MTDDLDALANHTISRSSLTPDELRPRVATLGARWRVVGPDLVCELAGQTGMTTCGAAVAYATELADELDHHPHIVMDYPRTTLAIHTHDQQAITLLDLVWAARLERWLRAHGW
ncbi:MAG: 4a-hydroxytetrahydrobiopterin dehydratase [Kofleriaceae bacterium]